MKRWLLLSFVCWGLLSIGCDRVNGIPGGPYAVRVSTPDLPATATYRVIFDPRVTFFPDHLTEADRTLLGNALVQSSADANWQELKHGQPDFWIVIYREEFERLRGAGSEVRVDVEDIDTAFTYRYRYPEGTLFAAHRRGNLIVDLVRAEDPTLVRQACDRAFFGHQWYASEQPGARKEHRAVFDLLWGDHLWAKPSPSDQKTQKTVPESRPEPPK